MRCRSAGRWEYLSDAAQGTDREAQASCRAQFAMTPLILVIGPGPSPGRGRIHRSGGSCQGRDRTLTVVRDLGDGLVLFARPRMNGSGPSRHASLAPLEQAEQMTFGVATSVVIAFAMGFTAASPALAGSRTSEPCAAAFRSYWRWVWGKGITASPGMFRHSRPPRPIVSVSARSLVLLRWSACSCWQDDAMPRTRFTLEPLEMSRAPVRMAACSGRLRRCGGRTCDGRHRDGPGSVRGLGRVGDL